MSHHRKIEFIYRLCLATFLLAGSAASAQPLKIVEKNKTYWQEVQADSLQKMLELKRLAPGIVYDLRYATRNNFTHEQLYPAGQKAFLRNRPARALALVQAELNKLGYGLKIFDAYRPYSVTKKMWELIHDERYVANPAKGSGHNRGISVDLTIIRLNTGKELDMGTGFDNFTDTAHQDFRNLPAPVLQNRALLRSLMEKQGFHALETEWWHFSWPNDRNYAVMDISAGKLGW
jgi:D-alanyl-D-alanine dipeptidase